MKSQTARVGSDDKDSASDVRATILSIILKDLNFISRAGGEQSKQAGLNNKHSVGWGHGPFDSPQLLHGRLPGLHYIYGGTLCFNKGRAHEFEGQMVH